jgi:hypothetical protein
MKNNKINSFRYLLKHEDYISLNINQKIQAKYFYLENSI